MAETKGWNGRGVAEISVWEHLPHSGTVLTVALRMAKYADEQGGSIYPSVATVATFARVSVDQARRAIHKLLADGFLELEMNREGGAGARHYRLKLARLWALPCVHAAGGPGSSACFYKVAARRGWELPQGMGGTPGTDATPGMDASPGMSRQLPLARAQEGGLHGRHPTPGTDARGVVREKPTERTLAPPAPESGAVPVDDNGEREPRRVMTPEARERLRNLTAAVTKRAEGGR